MRIPKLDHHKLRSWRRYARPVVRVMGGYSPFPMSVTIYITLACNLNCEMCCQRQSDALDPSSTKQMSFEDFTQILANLERSFPIKPRLHISGGEPSIHREFLPMVRYAIERGFTCSVTSNGARIAQASEELVMLGLSSITLSLDGVEELHNRIRGRADSYAHVVAAAQAMRTARDRAQLDYPMITINCVITRHNYHRLVDMIDLTQAIGGDYLTIQHLIYIEDTLFADHHIEDFDLLIEQLKTTQQLGQEKNIHVQLFPHVPIKSLKHYYLESVADDSLNCVEPWLRSSVMPNGDVLSCYSPIAGNALEAPFNRIWHGNVSREHRRNVARAIRRGDSLPSEFCQRCCYRLYD